MRCWICGNKANAKLIYKSDRLQGGSCIKRSGYQKITGWCQQCFDEHDRKQRDDIADSQQKLIDYAESIGMDTSGWIR